MKVDDDLRRGVLCAYLAGTVDGIMKSVATLEGVRLDGQWPTLYSWTVKFRDGGESVVQLMVMPTAAGRWGESCSTPTTTGEDKPASTTTP